MQRWGSHTEDEATSSGSSLQLGVPLWLPTALHTAPQAAHLCYNCSMASQTTQHISLPPSPPPSLALSLDFPVSSLEIEWMCAAVCGALHMTFPAHRTEKTFINKWKTLDYTSIDMNVLHCLIPPRMNLPVRNVIMSEPALVYFSPVRTASKTQQQHLFASLLRPFVQAECLWRPDADPVERQLISAFNSFIHFTSL